MSTAPEPAGTDLVAVACVVEASLLLASEWSRILIDYVCPLLQRLGELHPSHQFRLALVTYGPADTRPMPLLSKRYFAPISQVTKELRQDPSRLGIGQTNSGSGRGMSALEGLVAAIELFDMLMVSGNYPISHVQTQSPQKDNRSLISHLLHIAASPPDNAQRPHCNTLSHLDPVGWDSIPIELKKRKINLSLISLRKIPQFQDLQSSVAGSAVQSPWFNVRAPHILLLAGFPTPQKTGTKRQTDPLVPDQSPDAKRQKVATDSISNTSSASPALSSARIPQNQRSQQPQPVSSQVSQPPSTAVPGQNSSPVQPVQPTTLVPAATPATSTPSVTPSAPPPPTAPSVPASGPDVRAQLLPPTPFTVGQIVDRLRGIDNEIATIESRIPSAQNAGQTTFLVGLRKVLLAKTHVREQLRTLLRQHRQQFQLARAIANPNPNAQTAAAGSAEAGSSTQPHPPNASGVSSEQPKGSTMEEQKPAIFDSQVLAQFWQSRGGTISAPNGGNPQAGPSRAQSHPPANPEVTVQMQKPTEQKGVPPPGFGPSPQPSGSTNETASNPNAANIQVPVWQGTFSIPSQLTGQVSTEVQLHMAGFVHRSMLGDLRTDNWPKNFTLIPCKEPLKDGDIQAWIRRHRPRITLMRFSVNPRAPDGPVNEQKFRVLFKLMADRCLFCYAGWQSPTGKLSYNIIIFPVNGCFAAAFHPEGLPDLPGNGNALPVPMDSTQEVKPQAGTGGFPLPPALITRIQSLEPAKQKQVLAHFLRAQQQEQLRRLQMHQTQQSHTASGQALNSIGMPMPPNTHNMVPNGPAGLYANVNGLANSGAYNTGGGTVNYEMLQSFMQRNAEGSTSQGMNSG